jgi:hydroxymethylglutaryl-CoA synthase
LHKVGIDTLAFYTSRYALDLATLAHARHIEPEKYYVGLGQQMMVKTLLQWQQMLRNKL